MADEKVILRPQAGPQEQFLASSADIVIYGGAAGGGKSWALLLEGTRHTPTNKNFSAVYFRRNTTHIRNPGGLWDESMKIYGVIGGVPTPSIAEWKWPRGGKIKMAHLEYENTVLDWQGSQIPLICFDELTHFSMAQFFYMLSRNRSMSGVKGYVRATTNPDPDSWVAKFIEWWIDQITGFPILERSGKVRYFIRIGDELVWADTRQELIDQYGRPDLADDHPQQARPKSVTFIPAKLSDNQKLMENDPEYLANLMAMPTVERQRLLGGNWKIRPAAGLYFQRSDASCLAAAPTDIVEVVRYWDLAATEPSATNPDPDWTVGWKMGKYANGRLVVLNVKRVRVKASKVRELVLSTAKSDGKKVRIGLSQDPGQAGKDQSQSYVTMLHGYKVVVRRESGDKVDRAEPFAAQWQVGNVDYVGSEVSDSALSEMEGFPDAPHDDTVDAASGAYTILINRKSAKPAVAGGRTYE